jgi:uncharacterized protein YcbK (DUF882 family)
MLKPVSAALVVCLSSSSIAAEGPLAAAEIRKLVAGNIVELDAPLGNKLPVEYAEDGRLSGEARGLASHLGAPNDTGRWWVEANKLCHRWERWFNAETQCLELRKDGGRIQWRSAGGHTGTATVVPKRSTLAQAARSETDAGAIHFTRPRAPEALETSQPPTTRVPSPPGVEFDTSLPVEQRKAPLEGRMSVGAQPLPAAKPEMAPAPPVRSVQPPAAPQNVRPAPAARPTEPKPAPQSRSQPEPASPVFKVANVASADVLNVRSGPSSDHDIVGSLASETSGVHLTGPCQSRWCPIEHKSLTGWVNRAFLSSEEERQSNATARSEAAQSNRFIRALRDSPDAPRNCLSAAARALLETIESKFGPVRAVSTCRPGARIAGTGRISRHASGNAIDFDAGPRKDAIIEWLVANHHTGGTMTYADMDHIHVDIGPHFVSLASGRHVASRSRAWGERMSLGSRN